MARKGNGVDLSNEYLRQILEKLGEVLVSQEGMRREQEAMHLEQVAMRREQEGMRSELKEHGVRLSHIEDAVRQIAAFAGQEFQDLKRRVEVLERKAA